MNIQNNKQKDLLVEEWTKKAEDDELSARSILTHKDGAPSSVCLLSHQMAEKYFKAYLVLKKKRYPKIHILDELAGICLKIDSSFIEIKEPVSRLDPFYTPSRYPADYPDFTWQEAQQAFEVSQQIKEFVLKRIKSSPNSKEEGFISFWIIGIVIAIIISGIGYLALKQQKESVPQPQSTTEQIQDIKETSEINTLNWKTYRNEKYGFEVRYPEKWKTEEYEGKIFISFPGWREGLPEGGGSVIIEVRNINLEEFIDEYNKSDVLEDGSVLAEIIKQENFILDNISATKLTGTTALGVNVNFIFVRRDNKSYIIDFHDFDQSHLQILSTFKFIE